jgi:hypothetical protein
VPGLRANPPEADSPKPIFQIGRCANPWRDEKDNFRLMERFEHNLKK